jgi:tetratricopeptide (TPR) repeat protein
LIVNASAASAWEPRDAQYRHWLNVYRWRSVMRVDPEAGRVLMDDQARNYARRIVAELHATRALCPTFGLPLATAGQIELFFLGDIEAGERDIEQGYDLARANPQCCLIAGALDAGRGRWNDSREKLSRALTLGVSFDEVLNVYLRQTDRPDLAMDLAGDDVSRLTRVAQVLKGSGRHEDVAAAAGTRAAVAIRAQADEPSAPAYVLASAAQLVADQRDFDAAADYYRRALLSDYGRADWHLSRAQALAHLGRSDEAIREARLCLRTRPDAPEARQLIDELHPQAQAAYKEPPSSPPAVH